MCQLWLEHGKLEIGGFMWYYTLAIMDRGVKKYYADEDGWITEREQAVWFTDYQNALNIAFEENLEEGEFMIEGGIY